MKYVIPEIRLHMRETPSPRMDFFIGKGKSVFPKHMRAIAEVSLDLESPGATGSVRAFGCSADWPSVGWLDKRPGLSPEEKMKSLLGLVAFAAGVYLEEGRSGFDSPFELWLSSYRQILAEGRKRGLVDLASAFASSILERALIDAVCRIHGKPFHAALQANVFEMEPAAVHPELAGIEGFPSLPRAIPAAIAIRHTVGQGDPLTESDLDPLERVNDGEPETLEDYIRQDGLSHFKLKVSGDVEASLDRLARIWNVIERAKIASPRVTLDCNEAYACVEELERFVSLLEERLPELFSCIALIEQPLPRDLPPGEGDVPRLRRIAAKKPLIIDEGDGTLEAFREAREAGYTGVSHKNCKGVFKSLLNRLLCDRLIAGGEPALMSAEDLTHMPVVSLHQDFAVVAALGLTNAERNAHHYFLGLSHLGRDEQEAALEDYPETYLRRDGQVFLNIRNGAVDCSRVFSATGFGVVSWPSRAGRVPMEAWADAIQTSEPR